MFTSFLRGQILALLLISCDGGRFAADGAKAAEERNLQSSAAADAEHAASEEEAKGESDAKAGNDATAVLSESEARSSCAKASGIPLEEVAISGGEKNVKLGAREALSLRVTGHDNLVALDLLAQPAAMSAKAICIFIAGHENKVRIDLGIKLGTLYIVGRGDEGLVEVVTVKGASIADVKVDVAGHGGKVSIKGPGSYSCDPKLEALTCEVSPSNP